MEKPPPDSLIVQARVRACELAFLNAVIDAYDGIAVMRTLDHRLALIEFSVAPDFYEDFREIVTDLEQQLDLQVRWDRVAPARADGGAEETA